MAPPEASSNEQQAAPSSLEERLYAAGQEAQTKRPQDARPAPTWPASGGGADGASAPVEPEPANGAHGSHWNPTERVPELGANVDDDTDDQTTKLLNLNSVYNECTVPLNLEEDREMGASSAPRSPTLLDKTLEISARLANNCAGFTAVNLNGLSNPAVEPGDDGPNSIDCCGLEEAEHVFDDDRRSLAANSAPTANHGLNGNDVSCSYTASKTAACAAAAAAPAVHVKAGTNHSDMVLQGIQNLRLNVNSHIIGGSKNVMGRMRKLSISELHNRRNGRKLTLTFYAVLGSLAFLFLYLIYRSLFSD